MAQVLSLAYRPRTFSELIGQRVLTKAIINQYKSKREPQAWLFHGQSGGGKTTIARILALSLQCTHKGIGYPCKECRKNKSEFEIHEINASQISGVEVIEQVAEGSEYIPMPPTRKKVYILDEAQRLSSASQNLLLKFFEDAPKTTVWIICTTEPEKILNTLRRRCLQYSVIPLKRTGVEELVKSIAEKIETTKDLEPFLEAAYEAKINSPALILMAMERFLAGVPAEKAVQSSDSSVDTRIMAKALTQGDLETVHKIMKEVSIEDVRVIRVAVSKYLTAMLLKSPTDNKNIVKGITLLAQAGRVEESMQIQFTAAILHSLCRTFGGGNADDEEDEEKDDED